MLHLAVSGNSMRDYDIQNGQEIYTKPYGEEEKERIVDHPIHVLKRSDWRNIL